MNQDLDSTNRWSGIEVLVTGGASFIGSQLVDKLVALGSKVTVVDNLSSGRFENLSESLSKISFIKKDLEYTNRSEIREIFKDKNYVFHLAAVHGGRGYISTHPADVTSNLSIDHHVLEASSDVGIERVVFASSACVYPPKLQLDSSSLYKLKEVDSDPFNLDDYLSADIEYGWTKLISEMQLIAFHKQYGLKGCSARFVTAYGPRENETHAIIALIYKAIEQMDPYEIWGDGEQQRDFTYVEDIVDGCLLAAEKISDCTCINLGTGKQYKILDVARIIFKILDWEPSKLLFNTSKPVGVLARALDNTRAWHLLGWKPKYTLEQGIRLTIDWYSSIHKKQGIINESILLEHNKQ
jgi:nucleoside-diphosphate-sugar epimerase